MRSLPSAEPAATRPEGGSAASEVNAEVETIGVEVPISVELKVVETEPGFAGDTQAGAKKPATTDSGLVVQVPLFVDEGDTIKVDVVTDTDEDGKEEQKLDYTRIPGELTPTVESATDDAGDDASPDEGGPDGDGGGGQGDSDGGGGLDKGPDGPEGSSPTEEEPVIATN